MAGAEKNTATDTQEVEAVTGQMDKLQVPAASASNSKEKKNSAEERAALKAARAAARGGKGGAAKAEDDPLKDRYGDLPPYPSLKDSKRTVHRVKELTPELANQEVWIKGRVQTVRTKGKTMAFMVLRQREASVQAIIAVEEGVASKQMVKFAGDLPKESIVEVRGRVVVPEKEVTGTSQKVEIKVLELHSLSRAQGTPFDISDAARSDEAADAANLPKVNQDTRLDFRYLDLRTPANQAIFIVQAAICQLFREFMMRKGFQEIHTPKLIAGSSEGGANVFELQYLGNRPACLAQSPQLYKQMAICADFYRVFEIGPVFRAENSNTHRHMCEFTGLDFEMELDNHYFELLDVIEGLFFHLFEGLNQHYGRQLEVIREQYPFEPLQWKSVRISFKEGIALLKEAGNEIDELDDLSTEMERRLGALVKQKYGSDFYVMYGYPMEIRPFYTMPDPADKQYSYSYDVFIRGEEIISGAQRIHDPALLTEVAQQKGIEVEGIKDYVDSFRYGAPPHGGAGIGMERVVMLFCGLDNIRKTSMFPRDPKRLTP